MMVNGVYMVWEKSTIGSCLSFIFYIYNSDTTQSANLQNLISTFYFDCFNIKKG